SARNGLLGSESAQRRKNWERKLFCLLTSALMGDPNFLSATAVNPGFRASWRKANFKSLICNFEGTDDIKRTFRFYHTFKFVIVRLDGQYARAMPTMFLYVRYFPFNNYRQRWKDGSIGAVRAWEVWIPLLGKMVDSS